MWSLRHACFGVASLALGGCLLDATMTLDGGDTTSGSGGSTITTSDASTTGNGGSGATTTGSGGATTGGTGGGGGSVTGYAYRRQLQVTDPSIDPAMAGYSIAVTFDHEALVAAGKSQIDGDDLRVFRESGGTLVELDRTLDPSSAWNKAATRVWFASGAAIASLATDTSHWLHYGDPSAGPAPSNPAAVFRFFDDFEDGVLGASWSLAQMGGATGVATEASGALRIEGAAGDLWNATDNAFFYHLSVTGAFRAESLVRAYGGTQGAWAKIGGVMLRQSADAWSRNRIMSPVNGAAMRTNSRRVIDAQSTAEDAPGGANPIPDFAAVTRRDSISRAFHSDDGLTWTELGAPLVFTQALADPVLVGIPFANLGGGGTGFVEVEWFRVRLWVDPEPTVVVGVEELAP